MTNWPRAAARSSRGLAGCADIASGTEEFPHRARWILQHVQTHLQQCGGGGIELRYVEALLDCCPHQPGSAEAHAAFELVVRLVLREVAGRGIGLPEGAQERTRGLEWLGGHGDIGLWR